MRAAALAAVAVALLPAGLAGAASAPKAPDRVRAVPADGAILVTWRDRARDESRYEVGYRKAGRSEKRKRLKAGSRRWRHRVSAGTVGYRVRACAGSRCSRWSRRVTAAAGGPVAGRPGSAPVVGGCRVLPGDNPWNQDVSELPVHERSGEWIRAITAGSSSGRLHPDFGSNPEYGIPFVVVPPGQQGVAVNFTAYGDESDPGPYPIPLDAPVEGGAAGDGDRHVIALRQGECKLYELFRAFPRSGRWDADSGAVFDLSSNRLRREGWTSADAAGLPILPGLVRYDEVAEGAVRHALRFTARRTQSGHIHPATHDASSSDDPGLPPMGARVRMKGSFDVSGLTGHARVIAEAMKRYGMLLADNGSGWFFQGASDSRWNDDDLGQLKAVPGSAFEVVATGPIR